VAWDLAQHIGSETMPYLMSTTFLRNGAALGCGTFAAEPGYWYRYDDGTWYQPGDAWCVKNLPPRESAMLAQGVDVLVWPLGAWEQGDVRKPDGSILHARTPAMRDALIAEVVKRVDGYHARGVKRILFPQFACIRQQGTLGTTAYSDFIEQVLAGVVTQRPTVAAIAGTTPQVCTGGDRKAASTLDHALARDSDGIHWRVGAVGAAWPWRYWLVPALADLTGVTP